MTQTICRMYASPETARAAAEELQEFRQLTGAIHVVHPTSSPDATIDETRDRIAKCNVLRKDAQVLARGVLDGNSLVVVHAPCFRPNWSRNAWTSTSPRRARCRPGPSGNGFCGMRPRLSPRHSGCRRSVPTRPRSPVSGICRF